ncbi:MAG: hypothetical protein WC477_07805, partial [Patescibacteria group bacterium]
GENILGGISAAGGSLAGGAYKAVNPTAPLEEVQSIKDMAGLASIILAFHATGAGFKKIGEMRPEEVARAAGDVLGVPIKSNKIDMVKVENAYQAKVKDYQAIGGPSSAAKIDALTTARDMLGSYARIAAYPALRPEWSARFADKLSQAMALADKAASFGEAIQQSHDISTVLSSPATTKTRQVAKALEDPVTQYAFEREIISAADSNAPKGVKVNRIEDPADSRPAYYDTTTGEVTLNDTIIARDVARLLQGDTIVLGEKVPTAFKMKIGEHPDDLIRRYQETIILHETAHAKTITPDDVNRISEAERTGNQKQLDAIRSDLEHRAEQYIAKNTPRAKTPNMTKTDLLKARAEDLASRVIERKKSVEESRSKSSDLRTQKDALKFSKESEEAQYRDWKKRVSRDPELATLDVEGLQKRIKGEEASYERAKRGGRTTAAQVVEAQRRARILESLPDSNTVLDTFKERLQKERRINSELKSTKAGAENAGHETKAERKAREAIDAEIKRRESKPDYIERVKNLSEVEKNKLRNEMRRKLSEKDAKNIVERALRDDAANRVKAQIRQKFENKADAQQLLVDFMRSNGVPKEIRGSFIIKLKNVRTAEGAVRVIDAIKKEWDGFERKRLQAKIEKRLKSASVKTMNGLPRGKMTADIQTRINEVKMWVNASRDQVNIERLRISEEAMQNAPDGGAYELPPDVARRLELVSLGGIKDQSLRQLRETLGTIESYIEEGKTGREKMIEERKTRQADIAEEFVKEITGSEVRSRESGINPKFKVSKLKEGARKWFSVSSPMQALARRIGGGFQDLIERAASHGYKALVGFTKRAENLNTAAEEIYGGGSRWMNEQIKMSDVQTLGIFKDTEGVDVTIHKSRQQALAFWMWDHSDRGKTLIEKGNKWTPQIKNVVFSILTAEDKRLGNYLIEKGYGDLHDSLAKTFEEQNGVPLGYVENYAGPMKGDPMEQQKKYVGMTAEKVLADQNEYHISNDPAFVRKTKTSYYHELPDVNPVYEYLSYAKKAEWYVNTAKDVTDVNAVLMNKDFRRTVSEKFGKSMIDSFDYHAGNLTRGGTEQQWNPNIADRAQNNIFRALLSTPSVAAGQFSGRFQFKAEAALLDIKASDFRKGVRAMKDKANREMLMEYVHSLNFRRLKPASEYMRAPLKSRVSRGVNALGDW